jgi:predicted nucleotidyltransferase
MANVVAELHKKGLITPPNFVINSIQYLTIMGSVAYGVSSDTSDMDVYGFCIPPKEDIFPHLRGEIQGFGRQKQRFDQWQEHHIIDKSGMGGNGREYDLTVYSIIRFFQLCMDNNPNMIDSLFTPINCVLHINTVGNIVRENRREFLHKGSFHKFKSYAFSQRHKIIDKTTKRIVDLERKYDIQLTIDEINSLLEYHKDDENILNVPKDEFIEYKQLMETSGNSSRLEMVRKYGIDVKYSYHLVRLLNECEQILMDGDLDLQRDNEMLKSIRRGEWNFDEINNYFTTKERTLEELYVSSKLRFSPDENKIKSVLMECLETFYGSLDKIITIPNAGESLLREINDKLTNYFSSQRNT